MPLFRFSLAAAFAMALLLMPLLLIIYADADALRYAADTLTMLFRRSLMMLFADDTLR